MRLPKKWSMIQVSTRKVSEKSLFLILGQIRIDAQARETRALSGKFFRGGGIYCKKSKNIFTIYATA